MILQGLQCGMVLIIQDRHVTLGVSSISMCLAVCGRIKEGYIACYHVTCIPYPYTVATYLLGTLVRFM